MKPMALAALSLRPVGALLGCALLAGSLALGFGFAYADIAPAGALRGWATKGAAHQLHALGSAAPSPGWLSQTGLYEAGGTDRIHRAALPYAPQYPLWTDGADKRRWVRLPPGESIDGSNPDDLVFPVGTQFFKEFRFGRAVETRVIERSRDGWRFATYTWQANGRDARLAPAVGLPRAAQIRAFVFHDIPSSEDCRTCHESRNNPILGFTALQLSPARDPLAPHAETERGVDLHELVQRGLIEGLPAALVRDPPRIRAESPEGRATRGYLLGNCAHCHNSEGPLAGIGLDFDVKLTLPAHDALHRTAVGRLSQFQPAGAVARQRIFAGKPDESVVVQRMGSRDPVLQMPPLGSHLVDDEALELVRTFISRDLDGPRATKEHNP